MHARRQGEEPMGSRTVPAVPRRNLGGSCSVCTPEREPFVESRSVLSILVGAVVFATGCTSRPPGAVPPASTGEAPSGVVVTRDDPSLPTGCRPGAVATLLTDFFDALHTSSPLVIKRFFAPAPKFAWYSVTEGGGVDDRWRERPTFDRSRLLPVRTDEVDISLPTTQQA